MKLLWLEAAVEDLSRLRRFIEEHNPNAAARAAKKIIAVATRLASYPHLGKPVASMPEYRELGIRFGAAGYVLRYRIQDKIIYIVHLRHYRESF